MSAVDAPPGLDFAGLAHGEFRARGRSRKLAAVGFVYVLGVSAVAFALVARHPYRAGSQIGLIIPLMCVSFAGLGLAVRRARLSVDGTGIRWGWPSLGFRMDPSRVRSLKVYQDAVAVEPKRGSLWYLSARDWDRFDELARSLRRAGLEFERIDRRAPLRSRLQSYGGVLDALIVGSALVATLMALAQAVSR
ncbi:MAG: hypothetical protein KJO07_06175 [Deltaproteobacteria bacterium]|nr:hypothetical protein [Deltaproteobacteria bacterium]